MKNLIVSVDGPAGSGKRRIAKYISLKYKLFHLDSGILYRRLAYLIIKKKINTKNINTLKIFVNLQKNISSRDHKCLRIEKVSKTSSKIATYSFIREFINFHQKKIIKIKLKKYRGCVIDGRDIGSKVFKNARFKLFIDVKLKIRAKRRHKQLIANGEKSIYADILKEIKLRDKLDKHRKNSPLVIPKGAIIINNSSYFKLTSKKINSILNILNK